jgi:hypothetical protein
VTAVDVRHDPGVFGVRLVVGAEPVDGGSREELAARERTQPRAIELLELSLYAGSLR